VTDQLKHKLANLPTGPGVYLHKDAKKKVLYVGKAKNLRNRVRSYFQSGAQLEPKIRLMVAKVVDLDIIVTTSEVEALLIESNFIKQYRPPYNVVLRDDKQYLFAKVALGETWPRVLTTRNTADQTARYFGPYTSAGNLRANLKTLRRVFQYCTCSEPDHGADSGKRPCLYSHIGLCSAPKYGKISQGDYREMIDDLMQFLDGKTEKVTTQLTSEMKDAAANHRYERAADLRDKLQFLSTMATTQQAVDIRGQNRDVIALARDESQAVVILLTVRDGKVVARKEFTFWGSGESTDEELIDSFLGQYYKVATNLPEEVLIPLEVHNASLVAEYLTGQRGRKVVVAYPQRGVRRRLVKLAQENATEYLRQLRLQWMQDAELTDQALEQLLEALKLPKVPGRIECFDISTLSGTSTVGSMVVFRDGKADKAHYRRFQIKHVQGIDDFAAMQEVLRRRFRRLAADADKDPGTDESFGTIPDLVIIDGGKGQVSAAAAVMDDLGLTDVPLAGLAKRLEEVIKLDSGTGEFSSQQLPVDSQGLYLLQRIRDEAHRFAITYNRNIRSKKGIRSALDDVPGIGPTKKKQLMKQFGSVKAIRAADLPEIEAVIGKAAGRVVKENL